jgi:hypothetical protein
MGILRAKAMRQSFGENGRQVMAVNQPRYSKEEFARHSDEIYESTIRPTLKAGQKGQFVVIDIETGATRWMRTSWPHRLVCWPAYPMRKSGSGGSAPATLVASARVGGRWLPDWWPDSAARRRFA